MKILWLANVPAPYRVSFFNELGKYCKLKVLFEKRTSDERDDSWCEYKFNNFDGIILKGKNVNNDTAFCPGVIRYLSKDRYDHIIVTNFTDPTGMIAIEYMRIMKIPYWLESDGGFAKDGKGFKERIKTHFIRGAELYLSTGVSHSEYYIKYGANRNRIKLYPFSSIFDSEVLSAPIDALMQKRLREELSICEEKVVLAVGQFIFRKGFDVLLNACSNLKGNIGIYFIGGVPTEEYIEIVKKNDLSNVHFIDYRSKKEILKYYQIADVFVLPTREDIWGLVINEAMCCGTPVISTKQCGAALELINDSQNGYIVEAGNSELLREAIQKVLTCSDIMLLKRNALETARSHTIERMVARHISLFRKTLKEKNCKFNDVNI